MSTRYATAAPTAAGGVATERYVFVFGFTTQEQVDSLREATGLRPGDMGRWKGNDRVCISGEHVDAAVAWAREHRRAYEVSATVRFEPQQAAPPALEAAAPGAHITVHTAGSDSRSHYALIERELIETVEEMSDGTPDWHNGGLCDPWHGDSEFFYPAVALLTFLSNAAEARTG
ncbi:hypothetical protein [Micromonospora sp. NPDC001898]|uniref:Uncharacterized protein n=1 Tax=Micromonospora rubida TaxID=2697657 RepID=A0ABW7SH52_9ACTN